MLFLLNRVCKPMLGFKPFSQARGGHFHTLVECNCVSLSQKEGKMKYLIACGILI